MFRQPLNKYRLLRRYALIAVLVAAQGMPNLNAQPLRDPTRPPGVAKAHTTPAKADAPLLNTIIYGPGRRMASVNGHLLRVGDVKDGVELLAVSATSARVRYAGRILDLSLVSGNVHKDLK